MRGPLKIQVFMLMLILASGCGSLGKYGEITSFGTKEPMVAAWIDASTFGGAAFKVLPTKSMEPILVGGDWVTVDPKFPFSGIKSGDLVIYQAVWLPDTSDYVCHIAAQKSGDGWIMNGIANSHYEGGASSMREPQFRGKVTHIYTQRLGIN